MKAKEFDKKFDDNYEDTIDDPKQYTVRRIRAEASAKGRVCARTSVAIGF